MCDVEGESIIAIWVQTKCHAGVVASLVDGGAVKGKSIGSWAVISTGCVEALWRNGRAIDHVELPAKETSVLTLD